MPVRECCDYLAVQYVECGIQVDGAVPFAVVGCAFGQSRSHRQHLLCPLQCLCLRLLVDAEHDRLLGLMHVQSDHIHQLLPEMSVLAELE